VLRIVPGDRKEINLMHVSMRDAICGVIGLLLLSVTAFGSWTRPLVPAPAEDAVVATVGSVDCEFTSIREAVAAVPGGSVLRLAGESFTEGGIVLDKDLFLVGAVAGETIVQASESLETATERVFFVETGSIVVIRDVTMRYGHPTGECPRGGGAIANYGTLWLDRCILSDNIGQCGGALMNRDGIVSAFDCMFIHNESNGGVNMQGVSGMGSGGGIKNVKGEMLLDGCTIAYNVARKKGGGIKNCCLGTLTMINCTVSGNSCKSGGVHLNGPALIDHCTIAFNTAPFSLGAGILVNSRSVIRNTIVAGNTRGDVTIEMDKDGALSEFINVWIGDGRIGLGVVAGDPLLGPLGDNGGLTWTHLLLPGSGAIDAAVADREGPQVDQRGLPRPSGSAPDLGAVEVDASEGVGSCTAAARGSGGTVAYGKAAAIGTISTTLYSPPVSCNSPHCA
jgi:hypothetical protein